MLRSIGLPTRAPSLVPSQTAAQDGTLAEPLPSAGYIMIGSVA
jgi:hypothetical protein